jgi:23S rRNA (adenine2503-C2)-methyltransferase
MHKKSLFNLSFNEMGELVRSWDEPTYRTSQIWGGLYQQHQDEIDQFLNLPRKIRNRISEDYDLYNISHEKHLVSHDQTTEKVLFKLVDGLRIETVLMRYKNRQTVCISTQSGCAMGCTFCATGQMGFLRNLTSGEIVQQALYFNKLLTKTNQRITNIVMMGMGEPFHNYDEVMKAIYQMNHPDGMNLGARRFTISTVGLIPTIKRFTQEMHQVNLAVSLHAADDELRSSMLPIARKYPLGELMKACLEFTIRTGRRISFEWALIDGKNDTVEHAEQLVKLLNPFSDRNGSLCHVNVIPLNITSKYVGRPSKKYQVKRFCDVLSANGIPLSIRLRRGLDIHAGCGQLATLQPTRD